MTIRRPSGVIDLPAHALTRRSAIGVVLAAVLGAIPGKLRAGGQSVARVRRAYHDGRFGQLHYRIAGTAAAGGPRPLLCLHGSPYSGRIYETFLAVMGADRIALATDTPGFGDSDPPATVPAMSDHAAAIGDLLDASAFGEIDLLGCQAGSALAVEFALQRPRQRVYGRVQAEDRGRRWRAPRRTAICSKSLFVCSSSATSHALRERSHAARVRVPADTVIAGLRWTGVPLRAPRGYRGVIEPKAI